MSTTEKFDPLSAPAPGDLPARASRLATACAIVSMMVANPPSPVLRENLHEGTMHERWPLRDASSVAGAEELGLAAHESPQAQEADWRELIGPAAATRPVLSTLVPQAPSAPAEAEEGPASPSHLALLPRDHLAVVLSRTGSLAVHAVRATQAHTAQAAPAPAPSPDPAVPGTPGQDPAVLVRAFLATVHGLLEPLTPTVSEVLRARASTHLYHGVASLLDGITAEATNLAQAVWTRHSAGHQGLVQEAEALPDRSDRGSDVQGRGSLGQ